jgi:hypothetical protein
MDIIAGMRLPPGIRLGRYEIVALHGVGGMGEAYRATDSRLGRLTQVRTEYSVTADGQRFLLNNLAPDGEPSTITIVSNWQAGQ